MLLFMFCCCAALGAVIGLAVGHHIGQKEAFDSVEQQFPEYMQWRNMSIYSRDPDLLKPYHKCKYARHRQMHKNRRKV